MKKLFGVFFLTVFIFGMAGCSSDDEENIDEMTKQTILVFMPWSGSSSSQGLYPIMKVNVDSICSAIVANKGMRDSRLMLFLSETSNTSKLYEIVYNSSKSTCERNVIKEYSGQGYATTEGLTEILNEVKTRANALNYALIVGCHGTGWTFKESWHNYPHYAKSTGWPGESIPQERIPYQDYDGEITYKHTRFIGSVTDIATYSINIPDFAQAITNAGMKMQYILFDDCYMANVEVAYELRNVTNFLLASTSEVMAIGVPYRTMWKSLASATPGYANAVTAFNTFYKAYIMPYGTFSAIDCRKMEELAVAMRDVNSRYTLTDDVRSKIQVLDGFDEPVFYDMGDYLKNLCTDTKDYSHLMTVLESAIKSKCNTEKIYSFLYGSGREKYIDVNTFSGITISDPSINSVAKDGKEKTSWWKATHQ